MPTIQDMNRTKITNISDGTSAGDAINVGQLEKNGKKYNGTISSGTTTMNQYNGSSWTQGNSSGENNIITSFTVA